MKSRIRDTMLTLLGITALIVYVLACRPSFSPDGTKVVFPLIDTKARHASVFVYDLKEKTTETIAVAATNRDDHGESAICAVQWLPDGRQILVNGVSMIMILPFRSQIPTRVFNFNEDLEGSTLVWPPPVIGNYQFFPSQTTVSEKNTKGELVSVSKPEIMRVNLQTWESRTFPAKDEYALFGNGKQLYYTADTSVGEEKASEIGRVDPEAVTETVLITLKEAEYGKFGGFPGINKNGDRIALGAVLNDSLRILLVRDKTLEKVVQVTGVESNFKIGNLEWSPDEKSIFAAYARADKDDNAQFGVVQVQLDGGSTREMPLFKGKFKDESLLIFQIALSPDGRQVAASSVSMGSDEDVKQQDCALYVLDVGSPKWKVTKLSVPIPSASKSGAEKK